jgi:hypothetical protein
MTAVDEEKCASACAMIWIAGHFKFLSPNAQVGFHLPAFDEESKSLTNNIGVDRFSFGISSICRNRFNFATF